MYYICKFIKICKKYNYKKDTKMVSTLSFIFNKKNHQKYRSDFNEIVWMPFENIKIPVVKDYEKALSQEFGNWHEFIIGTSNHKEIFFDTENSFSMYLK